MTTNLGETDLMRVAANTEAEWMTTSPGALPGDASTARGAISAALAKARAEVGGAQSKIEQLRADDLMPAAGKARLIRERIDSAKTTVAEQLSRADNGFQVMRAELTIEALPKVTAGNELLARHDAEMMLDRSKDPHAAMAKLAQRGDDIGALVASSWGRDYLEARGADNEIFHQAVVASAVEAAGHQNLDERRQRAALHLQHLPVLEGARDAVYQGALQAIAELEGKQ